MLTNKRKQTMETLEKYQKLTPAELFTKNNIQEILKEIEKEALSLVPDVSTKKGQKEVASTAMKVAKCKTFLDKTGKELADELNAKLKPINGQRKLVRDTLDALKIEVRKPLTIIEEREKKRIADLQQRLSVFDVENYLNLQTSKELEAVLKTIEEIVIDESWQEFEVKAGALKVDCVVKLTEYLDDKLASEKEQQRLQAQKEAELREKIRKEEEQKAQLKYQQEEQRKQQEIDRTNLAIEAGKNAQKYEKKCTDELINDLTVSLFISKEQAKHFIKEIQQGKLRHLRLDF